MVSIGQNLAFRAAQLNSTQKTVKTEENTVENNTAANQAALNTSEGGAKTLMPSTELLLVNNGIKINKPETDKSSQEVNTNYYDYGDSYSIVRDLESGKFVEGDRVRLRGIDGQVIASENGLIVMFENGRTCCPGDPKEPLLSTDID